MKTLSPHSILALSRLRKTLDEHGYASLLAQYGWDLPRYQARRFDSLLLPAWLGSAVRFCEAGEPMSPKALGLRTEDCEALTIDGLLIADGADVRLASLRIVPHFGLLILCHARSPFATAYHGEDSLALGRHLLRLRPGSAVLDLCGGVGTQGLLAAARGAHVVSIDVNPSLVPLQIANEALNPVLGSIEFHTGHLYAPAVGRQFDAIIANPPLVPVPPQSKLGLPSDGGGTGLDITREIAVGAAEHLNEGGHIVLQGLSFGDGQAPRLGGVTDVLEMSGFSGHLTCFYKESVERPDVMMKALAVSIADANDVDEMAAAESYRELARRCGGSYIHSWQIHATQRPTRCGRIEKFAAHFRNNRLWLC